MARSTVTSKGQITIPHEVRKELGLHAGSRVAFVATGTGTYELVPETRSITELKGVIAAPAEPVTLGEMDTAVAEGAAQDSVR